MAERSKSEAEKGRKRKDALQHNKTQHTGNSGEERTRDGASVISKHTKKEGVAGAVVAVRSGLADGRRRGGVDGRSTRASPRRRHRSSTEVTRGRGIEKEGKGLTAAVRGAGVATRGRTAIRALCKPVRGRRILVSRHQQNLCHLLPRLVFPPPPLPPRATDSSLTSTVIVRRRERRRHFSRSASARASRSAWSWYEARWALRSILACTK